MKKFTQKEVNTLVNDIESNFTPLINAIIYYENNDKDDFSTDIIGYIEKLPILKELELLIKDFPNRQNNDFDIYGYQKLWLALINTQETQSTEILKREISHNNRLQEFLSNLVVDYDYGNETKHNVSQLLR